MDPLDPNQQLRSPDLLHGGNPLDHRSQANAYPQTYSDPSLLAFTSAEHGLGSPPLAFPPPDHSALQYALSANALASAQQQQQQQHQQQLQQDSGKKDIKRRTKTGCLTCRKRRIKCDEAQPECNNCRKSKRTCQGYDPLFRNQQSPASIQPASRTSKQSISHQHSTVQNAYPPPPAGYAAVQSSSSYPIATMSHVQNDTATFDFSATIDPALQSHGHVNMNQAGSANLFASNDQVYQTDVRPSSIEELMQIGAPYPDVTNAPAVTEDKKPDLKSLFGYYGPGLNKFLETQWYQQNAWSHIQQNPLLLDKYALLLSRMEFTAEQAPYENQINLTVEAHMIWETLELAKLVAQATKAGSNLDNDSMQPASGHIGIHETATRFEILKALITNTYLDPSILEDLTTYDSNVPTNINNLSKQLLNRERKFWRNTAKFLTLNTDTTSPDIVDAAVLDMRGLLESKENRDIIYSVAIMRVWPKRLMDQENRLRNEGNVNPQVDAENVKKVEVAKVFLTQQAGGRGTTPASQRICDMITKAWHPPPFAL